MDYGLTLNDVAKFVGASVVMVGTPTSIVESTSYALPRPV